VIRLAGLLVLVVVALALGGLMLARALVSWRAERRRVRAIRDAQRDADARDSVRRQRVDAIRRESGRLDVVPVAVEFRREALDEAAAEARRCVEVLPELPVSIDRTETFDHVACARIVTTVARFAWRPAT
jgi:hypothetical protein